MKAPDNGDASCSSGQRDAKSVRPESPKYNSPTMAFPSNLSRNGETVYESTLVNELQHPDPIPAKDAILLTKGYFLDDLGK